MHSPPGSAGDHSPNYSPYLQLVLARFREFSREPAAVFWVYVFPLMMMVALGLAFRDQPIETFDAMVVDQSEGAEQNSPAIASEHASSVAATLAQDPRLKVRIDSEAECRRKLRIGKTDLVILPQGEGEGFEYFFDGTKPGSLLARNIAEDILQRNAGRKDVYQATDHAVAEPGGRYIDFLIPGLIGMGIMGGGLFGLGYAIVDMRIRKLLKRFMATPMRRADFLAAVMTSRIIFTIPEILFLLIIARFLFGVLVHGSYISVAILVFLGTVQFAGIGLMIASRARTVETVSGLINLTLLPMWMLCGIFFSYERFPAFLHPLIRLLPLTPLVDSLRSVMLEGETLWTQGPEIAIIALWGVFSFLVALKWFRWV
jgi:ABC-type multidrug transport system permease subunit